MAEILTQSGFKSFDGFIHNGIQDTITIVCDNTSITCTHDHLLMDNEGEYIPAFFIEIGDLLYNGHVVIDIYKSERTDVYDAVDVQDTHSYITNGMVSHNCNLLLLDEFAHLGPNLADEFIASVFPTLSSSESSKLVIISTPNGLNHYHKLWVEAANGNNDFVTVEGRWQENPKRTLEWAEAQRKKLGDVKYRQEIECIAGDTMCTFRDKETGKIFNASIEDLYRLL